MSGESKLSILLKELNPTLHSGEYVFCLIRKLNESDIADCISMFKEDEGYSIVMLKENADKLALEYKGVYSWITLSVHSSLEAVGLTAAVSASLAEQNISCNVIAAYHHDHIFVPVLDSKKAMKCLISLSNLHAR